MKPLKKIRNKLDARMKAWQATVIGLKGKRSADAYRKPGSMKRAS